MIFVLVPRVRCLPVAIFAVLFAASSLPTRAAEDSPARFWGDLGVGYGNMQTHDSPVSSGGGGLWVDVQLGGRINRQWLAGLDLGGLGLHAGTRNNDPNSTYPTVWGETISNAFLVFQYEPKADHGWFLGGGAGEVLYNNKALEDLTGNAHSGNGPGGIARVGYDWPYARRGHFEAVLSYELGNIALNAPFTGNVHYSVVAASFHVAYH
jgi:hypothetical protein